ncbi:MAG: hypothetical protein N3A38_13815 [Planctomycetota bacterium]|nr:hypothetical protein [Planctomycetota bacterium]
MSPGDFGIGLVSPVILDSSTSLVPSITSPSTGTISPGFTITTSPGATTAAGMVRSCSSRTTRASLGNMPSSLTHVPDARDRTAVSSHLPSMAIVRMIAARSNLGGHPISSRSRVICPTSATNP